MEQISERNCGKHERFALNQIPVVVFKYNSWRLSGTADIVKRFSLSSGRE